MACANLPQELDDIKAAVLPIRRHPFAVSAWWAQPLLEAFLQPDCVLLSGALLRSWPWSHIHTCRPWLPLPQRLEDIHALERSMADKAGWAQLSPAEQQDKKRFYQVGGAGKEAWRAG